MNLQVTNMPHTYEELRDAAISVLLDDVPIVDRPSQWETFKRNLAVELQRRGGMEFPAGERPPDLDAHDAELSRDVFWDFFRLGHITLGLNDANPHWPFFRLSHQGQENLRVGNPYRFSDTATYIQMVRQYVPDLNETTQLYLEEAASSYHTGCMLASCVMLGVAMENQFNALLAETEDGRYALEFQGARNERFLLRKIGAFQQAIGRIRADIPRDIREGMETKLNTVQDVLRQHRNDAGHPSGARIERQQMFVFLQLFAPCAEKMRQISNFLRVQ